MDIQVSGLNGLVNKLNKLGGVNTNKIIDEGLRECALAIQAEAKEQIQKKKIFDEGYLFRSISVEQIFNGYSIGTNLEYAVYNEFGTGDKGDPSVPHTQRKFWRYKGKDGKWHTSHGMKARPYLRPAFKKHYRVARKTIRGKLLAILSERIK